MQSLLDFYQEEIYNPRQIQQVMKLREKVGPWEPEKEIYQRTEPLVDNKKVDDFLSTIFHRKGTRFTEIREQPLARNERSDGKDGSRHKSESALMNSPIIQFKKPKNINSNAVVVKQPSRSTFHNSEKKVFYHSRIPQEYKNRSKSTAIQIQVLPHNTSWNQQKIFQPSLPRFNVWKNVLKNQREKKSVRLQRSLFYLGNTTKYDTIQEKAGEVKLRVKKSLKPVKQGISHLTYTNLPHQKLLRMKSKQKEMYGYYNLSNY